jgi:predicted enzyme related to lactoylglutathione lyase
MEDVGGDGGPAYRSIRHEGAARGLNGGARELAPEQRGTAPYWMPDFTVASADSTAASATDAGGRLLTEPMRIETGARIAVVEDPQGAAFAVFEGPVDD